MGRLVFRRHPPGSLSLLQASDLTTLGAFKLPDTTGFNHGLTGRYIGAVAPENLRLYSFEGGSEDLIEFTPPGTLKTSAWDAATITYNYQDIFQNAIWDDVYEPGGQEGLASGIAPWRLYWDPIDEVMYSTHNLGYDNNYTLSPTAIIKSTLNDVAHTGTGIAAWRVSPKVAKGNRWLTEMLPVPSAYATAYTSGRRLGLGSGGGLSIISNDFSSGPALFAIDPPDVADNRDYISGGLSMLLYYPSSTVGNAGGPTRAPRPAALPTTHEFADGFGPTVWNWNDGFGGNSSAWFKGPNKQGFLTFCQLSGGNIDTTIIGSPAPTTLVFSVASPGDVQVGDHAKWETDVTDAQDPPYKFVHGPVTAVSGAQITVGSLLNGRPGGPSVATAIPTVGGQFLVGNLYVGGGAIIGRTYNTLYGYDSADLGLVAAGSVNAQRTPYFAEDFPLAGFSSPYDGVSVNYPQMVIQGSWVDFNVDPPQWYVMYYNIPGFPYPAQPSHLVFVFEVNW